MKLIIQIPCHNEAQVLPQTIASLPKQIDGIEATEILIIDDGSQDETIQAAQTAGAHHVIMLGGHSGLATAFRAGLEAALQCGADIIINTDADNQYHGGDVECLIRPILAGHAQIVVGDRGVASLKTFSPAKRLLQQVGNWVVALASGLHISDATSGFRA